MCSALNGQMVDLVADLEQLLGGRCARRAAGAAGWPPGQLARRPDLEELIEVVAEDGQELRPFEQRHVVVRGQGQHAGVEVEPGQLTVEEPGRVHLRRLTAGPSRIRRFGTRSQARPEPGAGRVTGAREGVSSEGSGVLEDPEVPLEHEVLALGIAHHALAVAAELRIVRRRRGRAMTRARKSSII